MLRSNQPLWAGATRPEDFQDQDKIMNHTPSQTVFIKSTAPLTVAISGPGSGKTQCVSDRIKWLIEGGIRPEDIVAISFTNESANQLEKRIGQKIGFCGTLHSWMFRLLLKHGSKVGLLKDLIILDEDEAESFLLGQLREMNLTSLSVTKVREAIAHGPVKGADKMSIAVNGYYQKLVATGTLDYDAMLHFGDLLMEKIQGLGVHLFVDEVQDSGEKDFSIYCKADFEFKTLIGDPDQAIYSFRGGRMENLLELTKRPEASVFSLETNFRSDLEICDVAQSLIERNKVRFNKRTISNSNNLGVVSFLKEYEGSHLEADKLIEELRLILKKDIASEVAILCRTNALVDYFSNLLQSSAIPVSKKKSVQLPADWNTCKLALMFLSNPENNYIAAKFLKRIKNFETDPLAYFEASVNRVHFDQVIPEGRDVIATLRQYGISENSIALLQQIESTLSDGFSIHEFCLAINREFSQKTERSDGVSVLTIHSAKGLEWNTVFLPAFEDETIPGNRKTVNVEEERRIAFVAVTRARHELIVSSSNSRQNPYSGGNLRMSPSRFIREMKGGL